jgi:hypothetical protein
VELRVRRTREREDVSLEEIEDRVLSLWERLKEE